MKLKVIDPSGIKFDQEIDMVLLPGSEGEMGILPNHMDMIAELKEGDIQIHKNSKIERISIKHGIVSIYNGTNIDVMLGT